MFIAMSTFFLISAAGLIQPALAVSVAHIVGRDGPSPGLNYDPNTTSYCTWWMDVKTDTTCSNALADNQITLEEFRRWVIRLSTV
jgi:hypothetical protein